MQLRAAGGLRPAFERPAFALRPWVGIEAAIGAGSLLRAKTMTNARSKRIQELNDAFRTTLTGGQCLLTRGVSEKGPPFATIAIAKVQSFNDFTPDNDPYNEHDFGSVEIDDEKLFWKIDYYDLTLEFGSSDPADPAQTKRVLTIMLADEY